MTELVKVLMERDGMEQDEAEEMVKDARKRILEGGEDPEEVLYDDFGLEPDYVFDLLGPE